MAKSVTPPKEMWWDITKILSYNCLFNFVVSNRGGGKTYGFKKYVISRFLKTGKQFMYLRRTEVELKEAKLTFFADVAKEFPRYEFKVKGNVAYMAEVLDDEGDMEDPDYGEWKEIGHFAYLSGARTKKSVSYDAVDTMCFDEFIMPMTGTAKYLPDEVVTFLDFYETVARIRDVTCFFLANSLNIINPYFMYWNIIDFTSRKGITRVADDMALEMVNNMQFQAFKRDTRFGRIIAGTDFERYAIGNEFIENTPDYIEKKTGNCYYMGTIEYDGLMFGIYKNGFEGIIYISQDIDPGYHRVYSCGNVKDIRKIVVKNKTSWQLIDHLVRYFQAGLVKFEDQVVKEKMWEFFRKML